MNFKKRIPDQQVGFQMAPMVDIMFILLKIGRAHV